MLNIEVRKFIEGDEIAICKMIKKDILAENVKDYSEEVIDFLMKYYNEDLIRQRAKLCSTYVFTDKNKIIGVGMIGPHQNSLEESAIFTIFIDNEYKGKGLGGTIIRTLEKDEYFKRANRIEIASTITAVEFYKHFGYKFKKLGNIVDKDGVYRMEKFPKFANINNDYEQYNMRPYIENEHYNYKEFIYQIKKEAYQKYVEEYWGIWDENLQRKLFENFIENSKQDLWIIQLNGEDIGFYNGKIYTDGNYEIGNICIIPKYQNRGIGTQVLKDIIELHKDKDLHIQYFKKNPVGNLYKRLGFIPNGETEFHYQMIYKKNN